MTGNNRESEVSRFPADYLSTAGLTLSVEERIKLARFAGAQKVVGPDEGMANYIIRIVALDAEVRVRQALAETLAENSAAPREIVHALVRDEELVAVPLLTVSEILTEGDLLQIIAEQISGAKLSAIARRREVSEAVCGALIEQGDEGAVAQLLRNDGARVSEPGLNRVIDRYGDREPIQAGLIDRRFLPPSVMERVVSLVSSELVSRLISRHDLPDTVAARLVTEARSHAVLGLTAGISSDALFDLIQQLAENGRLTRQLLLRSLCLGNLDFVMHVVAQRANLGVVYVRDRFSSRRIEDLRGLWMKARLFPEIFPVLKAAVAVLEDSVLDGGKWGILHFRSRIIERIVTGSDSVDGLWEDEEFAALMAASRQGSAEDDFAPTAPLAAGSNVN